MLNKNIGIFRVIRLASSGMASIFLAFLAFQILFPPASSMAADTATAKISVNVEPIIELAVDATEVALKYDGSAEISPTAAGVEATGTVNVYVSTNSTAGYDLKVYTSDATRNMTHSNSAVQTSIAPVSGTGGSSTLGENTWGFKVGSGNWYAVGANEASAVSVREEGRNTGLCNVTDFKTSYATCFSNGTAEKTTVTFGAKLTDALPAGTYSNNVVFTAVAGLDSNE